MSTPVTLAQNQQAEFALPVAQGTLSAVTLTVMQGPATVLAATPGTLVTPGDGVNQVYLWPATASLPLGTYTYTYAWALGGVAQTPITGTLTVALAGGADYTQWPQSADVLTRLSSAGITLRSGVVAARMSTVLLDVAQEVSRRTLRQFIADTGDSTRVYDGSGTPEQEVDEMVGLTGVTILGLQSNPGYPLSNPLLVYEQNKPYTRIVVGAGSAPAWTSEGVWMPFRSIFPSGRQNIQVTGRFGFAPTIPADLWAAVCGEMARRLAVEAASTGDNVTGWNGGDAAVTLTPGALMKSLGWQEDYEAKIGLYKRPNGRRLRRLHSPMI